jgi:hypothetical protein
MVLKCFIIIGLIIGRIVTGGLGGCSVFLSCSLISSLSTSFYIFSLLSLLIDAAIGTYNSSKYNLIIILSISLPKDGLAVKFNTDLFLFKIDTF